MFYVIHPVRCECLDGIVTYLMSKALCLSPEILCFPQTQQMHRTKMCDKQIKAKFTAPSLPEFGCSLDADSLWSASGRADGA